MRSDLLDILACPVCKGPLDLRADEIAPEGAADAGEVLTGALTCATCNEVYPIAGGIPNLLPPELRDTEIAAGR
ncbi:MAG: methytransferase partner Trm112 [Chloroflexota bacterium]|nr:methytransferase partner Trm112 [Chloroflexota bacterium]MDE2685415.1 methytransferase partner Trm112 [Chloroflexota bacterium]